MDAAKEELLGVLLKHRGELELGRAVSLLSRRNRKFVSGFGAFEFVKCFPQLFRQTSERKSKVMVKVDVPLTFCPQAGEIGGCADRRCDRLHLCPFFVKESCKFGGKCKRSHNYCDQHTFRVVNRINLGFLAFDSFLLQEILKIIVDEGEIQRAATVRSVPDICKFYNKGICKKGDLCPYLHVCEHFVDGDCKFGGRCKRDHDFSDEHNIRVLEEYDMDSISDRHVLHRLKGRERKRTVSANSQGPLLHEHLDVRDMPVSLRKEITIALSGGDEWMLVAEQLGLNPREIRFFDKRTQNPCDAALMCIADERYLSVGELYDVLNECGLPVIADLL